MKVDENSTFRYEPITTDSRRTSGSGEETRSEATEDAVYLQIDVYTSVFTD